MEGAAWTGATLCGADPARTESDESAITTKRLGPSPPRASAPPLGRHYEVGGRRLMLHRAGSSDPAVVFLPGGGQVGLDYLNTHNRAAELTTSVLYDRAGTGWSEPVNFPRTAAEVTDELRDAAAAPPAYPRPFLLVGHSLGGLVRTPLRAALPRRGGRPTPDGPIPRGPPRPRAPGRRERRWSRYTTGSGRSRRRSSSSKPATMPHRSSRSGLYLVRQPLIEHHLTTAWKAGLHEDRNLYDEVASVLRRAPGLPDVPLIVLTVLGHDDTQAQLWPEETLRQINDVKTTLHAQLAASVPHGEHQILDDAGHGWLHEDRPDAVLQAVTDLLHEADK